MLLLQVTASTTTSDCACTSEDLKAEKSKASSFESQLAGLREKSEEASKASAAAEKQMRDENEALKSKLALVKEGKTLMKTKLDQAESNANKISAQLQDAKKTLESKEAMKAKLEETENKANKLAAQLKDAGKQMESLEQDAKAKVSSATSRSGAAEEELKALRQKVKRLEVTAGAVAKKVAEQDTILSATDVQYFLSVREASSSGIAVLQEHASSALESSKAGLNTATKEASRMYEKGAPVMGEVHEKVLEAAQPHIDTVTEYVLFGIESLTKHLETFLNMVAEHLPMIKPHSPLIAKTASYLIIFLPLVVICMVVHFAIVCRMAKYLAILEYALLFFVLGVVFTVCGVAFATGKDPIKDLRTQNAAAYEFIHICLGGIAACLGIMQFSILLAKVDCGKGRFALAASLAAAVANMSFLVHYYHLVWKKAKADPSFSMSFEIKGDGDASYAEYFIFAAAVVAVAAVGTPSDWRLSVTAFLVAIQAIFAGFCCSLCVLDPLIPGVTESLFKVPHLQPALAATAGLLLVLLVGKALIQLFTRSSLRIPLQFVAVSEAIYRIGDGQYRNFQHGTSEAVSVASLAHCCKVLLAAVLLHVLFETYTDIKSKRSVPVLKKPNQKKKKN